MAQYLVNSTKGMNLLYHGLFSIASLGSLIYGAWANNIVSKKACPAQKLRTLTRTCIVMSAIGLTFSLCYIICSEKCVAHVKESEINQQFGGLMSKSMFVLCIVFLIVYLSVIYQIRDALKDCVTEGSSGLENFTKMIGIFGICVLLVIALQFMYVLSEWRKDKEIERHYKQEAFRKRIGLQQ